VCEKCVVCVCDVFVWGVGVENVHEKGVGGNKIISLIDRNHYWVHVLALQKVIMH
jgi:hypothetical protein